MKVLEAAAEASTSSEEENEEAGTSASRAAAAQEEGDVEMTDRSDDSDLPTGIGVLMPGKRPFPGTARQIAYQGGASHSQLSINRTPCGSTLHSLRFTTQRALQLPSKSIRGEQRELEMVKPAWMATAVLQQKQ